MLNGWMMKKILWGCLVCLGVTMLCQGLPNSITFQGRLVQNEVLVNGSKTFNFKIYDSLSGGTLLWATSNVVLQVRQGLYNIDLEPIDANTLSVNAAYLEITVDPAGTNDTLLPRTKLNSVGYALLAAQASSAETMPASGLIGVIQNSQLPSDINVSGTITANRFVGDGTGLTGTAASLTAGNAALAASATSLAGGVAGGIPYQSAVGTTGFSALGTAGQILQSNGTGAPAWVANNPSGTLSGLVQSSTAGNSWLTGGNVGIGTALPARGLDVYGASGLIVRNDVDPNVNGLFLQPGNGDGASFDVQNARIGSWYGLGFYSTLDTTTNMVINLRNGDIKTKGMLYTQNRIGIGTDAPGQALSIEGTQPIAEIRSAGYLMLRPTDNLYDMRIRAGGLGADSTVKLEFLAGGDLANPRMVIHQLGNVGIGTANPSQKLEVDGQIKLNAQSYTLANAQDCGVGERGSLVTDAQGVFYFCRPSDSKWRTVTLQ